MTFDKLAILYKDIIPGKVTSKKGNGFGTDGRFPADELERWKRKANAFNKGNTDDKKTINLAKDPTPSPANYSLISHWPGKKLKGKKGKEQDDAKLPNIFKNISRGPSISCYYASVG